MGKYDFTLEIYDDNTISWIANSVTDYALVLEFGPANGRLTKYLAEIKHCQVDIVEIDEEAGLDAARYAKDAFLGKEEGDIEKYHWVKEEKKYDVIIFADVLEHLVHPENVLDRCKAVIKKDGKILISIPNISHNSIIIELFNDQFMYNPTGILDNTHLRFFTRKTFEDMALKVGWTIVEERAKQIRVGETEILNSYEDIPKSILKELRHRPTGNVYQYMFVLAQSTDYLLGKCESIISLDSTSYYYAQVQYENEGKYDYTKSVTRHFDPYFGYIDIQFTILENSSSALVMPINCNCVLENIQVMVSDDSERKECVDFSMNGTVIGERVFFVHEIPEIKVKLHAGETKLEIKASILKYDFEDTVLDDILKRLVYEQKHIVEIVDDYENEIKRQEEEYRKIINGYKQQIEQKDMEYRENIESYKQQLEKKDMEYKNSVETYEIEIQRREEERLQMLSNRGKNEWKKLFKKN